MGTECSFAGSFARLQGSGVGGLLDVETVCGTEMATMSFEVMSTLHERPTLVLLPACGRQCAGERG